MASRFRHAVALSAKAELASSQVALNVTGLRAQLRQSFGARRMYLQYRVRVRCTNGLNILGMSSSRHPNDFRTLLDIRCSDRAVCASVG
jgi:hypothetical protein